MQRMHPDERAVDVELVGRLLASQFPQWADRPIERVVSSGTDNAMFRLGNDMSVRMPRIQWAVESVAKEFQWVPRLAPLLPVELPVPLVMGRPGEGFPWPWTVCRWVEGRNPIVGTLENPTRVADELAYVIKSLQQVTLPDGPPSGRGIPLAERDVPTRNAIRELAGTIDTEAVTEIWEASLRVPMWKGPQVWIHGDLSPMNLLLVDNDLTGLIDFGVAGVGDPACDVIPAWNLIPAKTRDQFCNSLDVDDDTWARGRGWALSIALIALPYYRDTNPALADSARHVIGEIISEN